MKIRHAFTGLIYERISEGAVKVVDPKSGKEGIFNEKGQWQSGELTYADFHLCGNLGGRQAAVDIQAAMSGPQGGDSTSSGDA
jgi:hypothetical protein